MIINMRNFTEKGRPLWEELDGELAQLAGNPARRLTLSQARRLHYLYSRTCADLSEMRTYGVERDVCLYLEGVCARAYAELHSMDKRRVSRVNLWEWLSVTFPCTVRRHWTRLAVSAALTLLGAVIGASLLALDPPSKEVLLPYSHLAIAPSERVAQEEKEARDPYEGRKFSGSAWYLTHNTRVSYTVLASGMTCGILTFLLLFSNGVLLGAVCYDYIAGGESLFLAGWLLPHGSVEIPGLLIAGQAGLIIAGALLGGETRQSLSMRLRAILPDIATLAAGIMLMMAWAGVIEAVFSQHHEPVMPYWLKVAFGSVQLVLLLWYFSFAGRKAMQHRCSEEHHSGQGPL